jgi:signal transduction histidine kinase
VLKILKMTLGRKLLSWISATADAPKATWKCYGMAAFLQLFVSFLSWKIKGESEALFTIIPVSLAFMTAVMGGRGPGYLAGVLAALSVDSLYISPLWHAFGSPAAIAFFVLTLLLINATLFLVGMLQRTAKDALEAKRLADNAVKSREDALAVIAHDLRQPIATLLLQAQVTLHAVGKGMQIDTVGKLNKSVTILKRMDRLIQDLLDSAKADTESFSLALEPVDLASLTSSVVTDFLPQATQKEIKVELKFPESELPPVTCDRNRLIRVITNLIGNSLKFTPNGGQIAIELGMPDSAYEQFRITNSGPNIPDEQVPNLFKRNWQANNTAHLGSGLGLYICHGIIKAHRGSIWYEPSPGPSFCFRLPLA